MEARSHPESYLPNIRLSSLENKKNVYILRDTSLSRFQFVTTHASLFNHGPPPHSPRNQLTMKSTLILSTIALAALSATSAAPTTPSGQWCDAFYAGCKKAALSVCGGNNSSSAKCYAEFSGTTCKAVDLSCNCTVTGGATFGAIKPALENTFAATGGVCSGLDYSNPDTPAPQPPVVPPPASVPTPNTITTTDGAVPPPTGVPTPNPTSVPTGIPSPNPTSVPAAASSAVASSSVPAPGPSTSTTPKSGAAKTKAGAVAMVAALAAGAALAVL